jgi:hypothetical protein
MNEITPTQQQQRARPPIVSGGIARGIIPQNMDEAWRLADLVFQAGLTPDGIDTPQKAMIAIMQGLEVGMPPMMALSSIAVINKRPTIWGDGALGLVRGSGLLESFKEFEEVRDGSLTAVCRLKRVGEDEIERTFSVADATTAGLINKPIWKQYAKRMRQMRARAYALRDTFADVLKGLQIREEVQDYQMKDVTPGTAPLVPEQAAQGSPPVSQTRDAGPPVHLLENNAQVPLPPVKAAEPEVVTVDGEVLPPAVARARKLKAQEELTVPSVPSPNQHPMVFLRYAEDTLNKVTPGPGVDISFAEIQQELVDAVQNADDQTIQELSGILRSHEKRLGLGG